MMLMRVSLKVGYLLKTIRQIGHLLGLKNTIIREWYLNALVILLNILSNSSSIVCMGSLPNVPVGIRKRGKLLGIINWSGQDTSLVLAAQECTDWQEWFLDQVLF